MITLESNFALCATKTMLENCFNHATNVFIPFNAFLLCTCILFLNINLSFTALPDTAVAEYEMDWVIRRTYCENDSSETHAPIWVTSQSYPEIKEINYTNVTG